MKCSSGKVMFYFEKDAWLFAFKIFKLRKFDQKVYLCPICKNYHLTNKKGIIPQWLIDIMDYESKKYPK